jgi:hypothetical protein
MSMREVVLIHFQNLSNEIVVDGLGHEYEPALDRLMNWLYWEFTDGHPELKDDYLKEMTINLESKKASTDAEKGARIQRKEWLLSRLLASHGIDLGKPTPLEKSDLGTDMSGIDSENVNQDGLLGKDGEEDSE